MLLRHTQCETFARHDYGRIEYDPSCSLAADLFKRAAALWSANVTFARMDVDEAPRAAAAVGNGPLPQYALALAHLSDLVRYSGGWSEASIGAWLHRQLAVSPTSVRDMSDAARLARANPHGLLILGLLTTVPRGRLLLEHAARASDTHGSVAILEESAQAAQLLGDLVQPCVVIIRRDATEPWMMLRPPLRNKLEAFLLRRAMPLVIALEIRVAHSYGKCVLTLKCQVVLVHISGAPDRIANRTRRSSAAPWLQPLN